MCSVRTEPDKMSVVGVKANVGHTEPGAGAAGLMQLVVALESLVACPNAQLRVMNSHVKGVVDSGCPSLPVQAEGVRATAGEYVGGTSSFGLYGTIVHALLSRAGAEPAGNPLKMPALVYRRRAFSWREEATSTEIVY